MGRQQEWANGRNEKNGFGKKERFLIKTAVAAICISSLTLAGSAAGYERIFDQPSPGSIAAAAEKQEPRTVAIVIDDFGNGMNGTAEMMKLPVKITAAIMPFMPTTKQDAEEAHRLGHDVIVHMPMEPNKGLKKWLGPGALTTDLSDAEVRKRVEEAIDNVPHAIGMNNHMGSKVTADERMMRIVLGVCKERGLFFLDSRTTFKTVVPKIAAELGVPLVSNDVFLDDVYTVQHISKQIGVLRKHLELHASCITIGHVGPAGLKTAAVLQQSIPAMQQSVQFVKLTKLIPGDSMNDPLILPNP
ncbi:divergent polysaccharide deacetylase family protein [Paenibacillus sp. FJAT-27812]|uniref:divergent polysaccharide deacetylase family protein n=1 Tax=Paenibacillus sp. FJAT-27812 TaxID=1684143 RepID=UPI0009E7E032|nr:divergent polysaccharide deacetylase family protein [Paenibacillus sp. FJAT-27812]